MSDYSLLKYKLLLWFDKLNNTYHCFQFYFLSVDLVTIHTFIHVLKYQNEVQ